MICSRSFVRSRLGRLLVAEHQQPKPRPRINIHNDARTGHHPPGGRLLMAHHVGPSERIVKVAADFCVGGLREVFMPAIDVDGVGQIAFPLLPVQVERLVAIAEAAPYGRGEETVVDRDVRRTWQIEPGKVRIGGRHWV